jgi:hypothetical protein
VELRPLIYGLLVWALFGHIIALLRRKRAEDLLLGELEHKLGSQETTTETLTQISARREEPAACQAATGNHDWKTMTDPMPNHLDKREEEELVLANNSTPVPRRLPWCETDEDYESVIAELAAEECRWR